MPMPFQVVLIFVLSTVFAASLAKEITEDDSELWQEFVEKFPSEEREARAIWLPSRKNNQCTGGVFTMVDGDAMELKSHKSYGSEAYPSDYQVRNTSFIEPVDGAVILGFLPCP